MAVQESFDNVLVRLIENSYIRSHLDEVEGIQLTSGVYYTLYGDGKRIDEKTNKKIDLKEFKKQYDKLRIFVFNTNSFIKTIGFEAESKDYKTIKGSITCRMEIDNRKITSAEKVEFKETKNGKVFTKDDSVNVLSPQFRESADAFIKKYDAAEISEQQESLVKGFKIPKMAADWCSDRGFKISAVLSITSNQYEEDDKSSIEQDERRKAQEKKLEELKLQEQIEATKARISDRRKKAEIAAQTGETRSNFIFREVRSKAVLYGMMNDDDAFETDDYIIGVNGGDCSISTCKKRDAKIEFPSSLKLDGHNLNVTDVGPKVFGKDTGHVTDVTVEEGIRRIDSRAFQGCSNLRSISLPESLEYIGKMSFNGCISLKAVVIPDNVKDIDREAFVGCPLRELIVPDDVNLDDVILPKTVSIICRSE